MAGKKNKGGKGGKSQAPPKAAEPEPAPTPSEPATVAEPKPDHAVPEQAVATSLMATPAASDSPLQAENDALKAELEQLKAALAAKDSEIAELKAKVDSAAAVPPSVATSGKSVEEMTALRERLMKLKKDQAEADKAKEAAWLELKRCVQEVAKLASAGVKEAQSITSN